MAVTRISEAEAAREFNSVIARVRAGGEAVIGSDTILRSIPERPLRRLSKSLRLAQEHHSSVTFYGGFVADLNAIVNEHRETLNYSEWD